MGPVAGEHPEKGISYQPLYIDKAQAIMLAAAAFLLSIKSDKRFPLPEAMPEPLFQLLLIPYTLVFIGVLAIFLWPGKWPSVTGRLGFLNRLPMLKLTVIVSIVFEAMALALLVVENARFKAFGYELDFGITCLLFASIFAVQAGLLLYSGLKPAHVLAFAVAAYAGTCLLSIFSFPLAEGRSDMLPLIMAALGHFLAGNPPYAYFFPPNHLPLTYLPMLWLSYLPAALFGFDPRLINLMCAVAAAAVIYRTAVNKEKAAALLTIFLLTPYLQFRHELYLGVLWLFLAALFYAVVKKRLAANAFIMALIAATYQLAWIFMPFLFAHLLHAYDKKSLGKATLVFLATGAALIVPFAVWSPHDLFNSIFGYWVGQRSVSSANFSYILSRVIGWDRLKFAQAGALITLFLFGFTRVSSSSGLFKYLSATLIVFILLSSFIDAYFYLIVLLLLIFYALAPDRHHS